MSTEVPIHQNEGRFGQVLATPAMHLPAFDVSMLGYHARLRASFNSPTAKFYVDTSLLMWLLRISAAARAQFLGWCNLPSKSAQVIITTWCAHEFYRHLREKTILLQMNKLIGDQVGQLNDLLKFVDQVCDDQFCRQTAYPNRIAAIEDLRNHASQIEIYLKAIKGNKRLETAYVSAVEEVTAFINTHLVATEALKLVSKISPEFENRFEGRLPPGYKDGGKRENAFGDFVFWQEVLSHGKNGTVIILSNDGKNDWIHSAISVETYRGRSVSRKSFPGAEAQFPHPVLVFEASEAGIERLEVLNIAIFSSFLEVESPHSMPLLLAAAHPRGFTEGPSPDWQALGITRPAAQRLIDITTVSLSSLRNHIQSELLESTLSAMQGDRAEVAEALSDDRLLAFLVELDATELTVFGMRLLEASARFSESISLADVVAAAHDISPATSEAIKLGLLIGIYFSTDYQARATPDGTTAQGVFPLVSSEMSRDTLAQLRTILDSENVWLVIRPPFFGNVVTVDIQFQEAPLSGPQVLESVSLAGNELLDSASADARRISTLLGANDASIEDLLTLLALHFVIPRTSLNADLDVAKRFIWEQFAGLGLLRTDLRKVAFDIDVIFEGQD